MVIRLSLCSAALGAAEWAGVDKVEAAQAARRSAKIRMRNSLFWGGQMALELRLDGETKMSSIGRPNSSAMRKASGSDGSYLPVSMAVKLLRGTPIRSARACLP